MWYNPNMEDHPRWSPTLDHPATSGGPGIKYDNDKPDYSLLPFYALEEVTRALTYGAKKYSRDNWRRVPNFHTRYLAAAFRHITAHARGELRDPETGLLHMAHAVVSLMYIAEDILTITRGDKGA